MHHCVWQHSLASLLLAGCQALFKRDREKGTCHMVSCCMRSSMLHTLRCLGTVCLPHVRYSCVMDLSSIVACCFLHLRQLNAVWCTQAEVLWLMAAKEKWLSGDVHGARLILSEAFSANPDSEEIWLAAFKLEFENKEPERAKAILEKARGTESSSTQRVWMKSAVVERELGNVAAERGLLEESLKRFPYFDKLWLMLGQLEERQARQEAARQVHTMQPISAVCS